MKAATLTRYSAKEAVMLMAGAMLAAAMMFGVAAPRAHAAALTEPQIQAILNLLAAFSVPQAEIDNVNVILHQSK
jgi:hypothetical protein